MSEGTEADPVGGGRWLIVPVLVLVAIMWIAEFLDLLIPADLNGYGISSRSVEGLWGVALAPFLHSGFGHLIANTVPFVILGLLIAWRARTHFWAIFITIVLVGGLGVWLLAPSDVVTIGASGVIFGFLAYLLVAGILTRHWVDVIISVAVFLVYGGLLGGVLPWGVPAGVSWLGHLLGAGAGALAAFWFARPAAEARSSS